MALQHADRVARAQHWQCRTQINNAGTIKGWSRRECQGSEHWPRRSLGGREIWPHKGYMQTGLDGSLGLWVETSATLGGECIWP